MPPSLLQSQFAALEPPREAIVADIGDSPAAIVAAVLPQLRAEGEADERKQAAN
jgi:gluconate kinase